MATGVNKNTTLNGNPTFNPTINFRIVRVYDVILDNTHPLYFGADSIGVIYYGDINLNINSEDKLAIRGLSKAAPIFPHITYVPSLQEIVKVEEHIASNIYPKTKGNASKIKSYYYPSINIHNNPSQNALPASGESEFKLGEYLEDSSFKKLQRFEGDLILEGRFGNGLRFGSSTPRGKNNWSNNNSLGDPITILSNGLENQDGDALLEDINTTKSMLVLTSKQNIDNFTPVSLNTKSTGTRFTVSTKSSVLIEDTSTIFTGIQEDIDDLAFQADLVFNLIDKPAPTPESEIQTATDDPIFNLLQEQVEEGLINSIYNFEFIAPDYGAAPLPDDIDEEIDEEIYNEFDYDNQLPINETPSKVKYKPVYLGNSRVWTKISYRNLAQKINLHARDYSKSIRLSILAVAINEQGKGNTTGGFNYNHYGIMADIGNWTNGNLYSNGSVCSTEGAGGQGVRTDKFRYFMSFPNEKNGILFMAEALDRKGFNSITSGTRLADKYVRNWLSPANPDKIIRQSKTKYQKLYDQTNKLITETEFA